MKFRKLLAAGLAACSLLTFAACKTGNSSTNLDEYRREDEVGLTSYTTENPLTAIRFALPLTQDPNSRTRW